MTWLTRLSQQPCNVKHVYLNSVEPIRVMTCKQIRSNISTKTMDLNMLLPFVVS